MAKITIDGKVFEVDPNNNLLEECLSHQMDLPYFCWHPSMGSVGSCRQCAVIEYADSEDTKGRQVMACMTVPRDGARYSLKGAAKFRAQAIESLMINHPHDCPVCEEGGECHLQDMTVMSGHNYRRYDGKKKTHYNQYLGPFINHEMNRCITCYRCVRFYKDYAGGTDFSVQASHDHVYFGRWQEGALESEFSGNLAEVCPTGVFTDKPFSKRYTRKWDLQTAPSVCAGCSVGCNITPGERYGTLRRVVNRFNDEVNGYFICDRGRFGAGYVSNTDVRITANMTRDRHDAKPVFAEAPTAEGQLQNLAGNAIGIGSPRASMEANFALREFVGADNFYAGIPGAELGMLRRILDIYQSRPVNIASIKDIENSDAVLILGEDVTNTAPRIALALRQSVKNLANDMAAEQKFPAWHNAAVRNLAQNRKSPLYILSPHTTRLDDVAKTVRIDSAASNVALAIAIAHELDPTAPAATGLSNEGQALAVEIAATLKNARQALVVSGTGSKSSALIEAAANIATALANGEKKANLALVAPENNSMGLAILMGGSDKSLDQAMAAGSKKAIVLENDLYRRAPQAEVDQFIRGLDHLTVLDSIKHRTGEQAHLVLAAAAFAETAGTYVNYETRAQHFYSVYKPDAAIRSSAQWLSPGSKIHELTAACAALIGETEDFRHLSPGPDYNYEGLKAPRQSHRYSGRTAMHANISVHEPKPPRDEEGVMVYSMEGVSQSKDSTVFNSPWAPGWNSNQSIFKFQEEVGGPVKLASRGEILVENTASAKDYYSIDVPKVSGDGFEVFPLYHIFGSDELSAHTPAIQEKATSAYVALNPEDAKKLQLQASDGVQVEHNGSVPFITRDAIAPGTVGVTVGLAGLNFSDITQGTVTLGKAADWKSPAGWRESNIIVSDKRSA